MSELTKKIDGEVSAIDLGAVEPADAFMSMLVAMLKEPFMSGDTKQIVIMGSRGILEARGYTEDELDDYFKRVAKAVDTFHKPNGFMG